MKGGTVANNEQEEAVYRALKRRDDEQEFGRLGRWVFFLVVIAIGIATVAWVLWGIFS
ncbi:MAG: hypothetical protein RIE77_07075 [Phycisphaerales bacterium]|jgi:hypothetical protein